MEYPIRLAADYPGEQSQGIAVLRLLLGWAYVGIPHGLCLAIYGFAVSIAVLIGFFAILFTRKFPPDLYNFVLGYFRWHARVHAYLMFMTDVYPPFSPAE
jgi:hypothetical protein